MIKCWDCTMKHVACAIVLMDEVGSYPIHRWLIVGHLCQAEAECPSASIVCSIREQRLVVMDGGGLDYSLLEDCYEAFTSIEPHH